MGLDRSRPGCGTPSNQTLETLPSVTLKKFPVKLAEFHWQLETER
jgi:hypothetical protein